MPSCQPTIKNGLNHITTINEYNAHGQPLKITDPNTMVTALVYDARMRLTSLHSNHCRPVIRQACKS